MVPVSGNAPPGDLRVSGSFDFGEVCPGVRAEQRLNTYNVGACNLHVLNAFFGPACSDFRIINRWFPATVSPDFCMDLIVRFKPTSAGPKSCTLVIQTDDPDTPSREAVVTGNTPAPSIDVPPDIPFPPMPMVESLKIQRINANRNRNQLDTVESAQDLPDDHHRLLTRR